MAAKADKIKGKDIPKLINITNALDANTIQLYGYIGEDSDIDWEPFQNIFRPMDQPGSTIYILANCYGGNIFSGLAIYDLIKNAKAKVYFTNEGICGSMGAILALAVPFENRKCTKNSRYMFHRVQGGTYGDADDLKEYSDQLLKEENQIKDIIIEATGQDEKTVSSWMKRGIDKWFNSSEAKTYGIVNEVIESSNNTNTIATNQLKGKSPEQVWVMFNSIENKNKIDNMNKFKMAILALMTTAGISNSLNETDSDEKWIEAMNNAINSIQSKATEAVNKLSKLNSDRATDLIENAINSGKLPQDLDKAKKDEFIKNATTNYDMVSSMINSLSPSDKTEDNTPRGQGFDINNALDKQASNRGLGSNVPEDRKMWNLTKWAKEDPDGLSQLQKSNPEHFQGLLNQVENSLLDDGTKKIS